MNDSLKVVLVKDKPAILLFPSRKISQFQKSYNLVEYEDGSLQAVPDCDIINMGVQNDRTTEIEE